MNNSTFNPTTATLPQLRAFCNENNIIVVGDRRRRSTFIDAIQIQYEEPNELVDEPTTTHDEDLVPYFPSAGTAESLADLMGVEYCSLEPTVYEYCDLSDAPQHNEDAQEAPSNAQPTPWFISFIAYLVWLFIRLFRRRSSYRMA